MHAIKTIPVDTVGWEILPIKAMEGLYIDEFHLHGSKVRGVRGKEGCKNAVAKHLYFLYFLACVCYTYYNNGGKHHRPHRCVF